MLTPIVSSVLLFLFLITTCSNAEHCFCPVKEDVIIYHEPLLSAAQEGVIDDKQIIKGSYIGEWIRLEGENPLFALLEDFMDCKCPRDETGQRFDCIDNSCNQSARRQLNGVAFWNTWNEWSSCSLTCGLNGIHYRRRECQSNGVSVNISNCPGTAREFKKCGQLPDCEKTKEPVWEDWGRWSACSQTCEAGFRQRLRQCSSNCPPLLPQIENSTCFDNGCNVTWTSWFDWQDCTKSCGGGLRIRFRECTDGKKSMNLNDCPFGETNPKGFYEIGLCSSIPCEYSEWSEWGVCATLPNISCGSGVSFRNHTCLSSKPSGCSTPNTFSHRQCYIPCTGRWSDWENWSQCDLTCGSGTQSRTRDCDVTASVGNYTDLNCTGDDFQTMSCNTAKCPVDGQYSAWSNWTKCSETCGGGRQERSRTCDSPHPAYGGQNCLGDEKEQRECSVEICPRDGGWSNWYAWSECSQTCGTAIHVRERKCNNPTPLGDGLICNGSHQNIDFCMLQPCSVDGRWTDWTPWSACSCENATFRRRECTNPAPVGGGQDCIGVAAENSICTHQGTECPVIQVNGEWTEWIPWGRCSVTCDQGVEQRFRTCTNPRPSNGGEYCFGNESISRKCMEIHCPEKSHIKESKSTRIDVNGVLFSLTRLIHVTYWLSTGSDLLSLTTPSPYEVPVTRWIIQINDSKVNGGWSDWGTWSECSVTCENGTRVRNRTCDNPAPEFHGDDCVGNNQETDICLTNRMCPIDGDWADWSSWSDCSETCNNGTLIRSRNCSNPEPEYGGKICTGKSTETSICFLVDCPVDGAWSVWENWSSCSRTCDGGNRTRTRTCTSPTPRYGGLNCSGPEIENEFCYLQSCKINGSWNTWEKWTPCSLTCSNGTRQRIRLCDNPPPLNGGSYCNGSYNEAGDCFRYCPQNGAWASWMPWNDCSVTCGYGTGFRTRTCSNPLPLYGGKNCTGSNKDTGTCFLTECPVNGSWGNWYQWSHCTVTCETGTKSRARVCRNPPPQFGGAYCQGTGRENVTCDMGSCDAISTTTDASPTPNTATVSTAAHTPNTGHTTHVHGSTAISTSPAVTVHTTPTTTTPAITTSFTVISQTSCDDDPDGDCHIPSILHFVCQHNDTAEKYCKRSCGLCPKVNGGWSDWGSWSPCSVTCENGTHVRNRTCDNPAPKFGGSDCVGSNEEAENCFTIWCPINGGWSTWLPWKNCSVTCGNGTRSRTRTCDNPLPQFGGMNCPGTKSDHGYCFPTECPVDGVWADWSDWRPCSVTCANGTEYRTRNCYGPFYGGQDCSGYYNETQACSKGSCPTSCDDDPDGDCHIPSILHFVCQHNDTADKYCKRSCGLCPKVNGGWSDWESWSPCSVTCENGTHLRNRTCDNPAPQFGGDDCVGSNEEAEDCDTSLMCPTPCADLLETECGKPNLLAFICQHNNTADHYCKRSCGRCPKVSSLVEENPRAVHKREADCPRIRSPMNSLVSDYTTSVGSVMSIECLPGFHLVGPMFRICLSNGTWSGTDAICQTFS